MGKFSQQLRIVDLVCGILLWTALIAAILGALAGWRAENGGNLRRAAALTAAVLIAIDVPGYRDYGYQVKVLYPSTPWMVGLGANIVGQAEQTAATPPPHLTLLDLLRRAPLPSQ